MVSQPEREFPGGFGGDAQWRPATPPSHPDGGAGEDRPTPRRWRRRSRRTWARRHPIGTVLLALMLVVLIGVGALTSRAVSTVATLQAQSTPPPVVRLASEYAVDQIMQASPAGAVVTASPAASPVTTAAQTVDTQPALDAVEAAGIEYESSDGIIGSFRAGASGVMDIADGAAAASGDEETSVPPMTILLMGVDARPGEAIDVGVRPDALAILRLDPETGDCRMLNIPRDTRVELPGYGLTKINHALAVGGIPYQQLVVESFLGVELDRYALIDFGGIKTVVDAMGGVSIEVPETFTHEGITFQAGTRLLSGEEALVYARYRYGPDGDFGRIQRQQQILRSLLRDAVTQDPVTIIRELLPQLQDHLRTDLSPLELVTLGTKLRSSCTDETLVTLSLDGSVATFNDPLLNLSLSYVVVPDDEVRRKVEELMNGS